MRDPDETLPHYISIIYMMSRDNSTLLFLPLYHKLLPMPLALRLEAHFSASKIANVKYK